MAGFSVLDWQQLQRLQPAVAHMCGNRLDCLNENFKPAADLLSAVWPRRFTAGQRKQVRQLYPVQVQDR